MHQSTQQNYKRQKSPQKTHTLKKIQHKLQTNVKILEKTKMKNYEKILKLTALLLFLFKEILNRKFECT